MEQHLSLIPPDELAGRIADNLLPRLASMLRDQQPDEPLTQKEAASFLKCSLNTLNEWGKKGIVQPIRKGSRVYYLRSQLLTLKSKAA